MQASVGIALWMGSLLKADQVIMANGDLYNGTVVFLTTNSVVLTNEYLGKAALPRAKVTAITFGSLSAATINTPTNRQVQPPSARPTNSDSELSAILRGIKQDTNLIQRVQSQMLGSASPKATTKFDEMLNGLSTGQMDMKGLRAEAQSAADELRSLKKDLGPDADTEVDGYLSILDSFLNETTVTPSNP